MEAKAILGIVVPPFVSPVLYNHSMPRIRYHQQLCRPRVAQRAAPWAAPLEREEAG